MEVFCGNQVKNQVIVERLCAISLKLIVTIKLEIKLTHHNPFGILHIAPKGRNILARR